MSKRIITLGDSTMQDNNFKKFPQTGWPQALPRFVKKNVEILNFAANGKSTKNFISLGLFDKALELIVPGDLVLIEFGHNDQKYEDQNRFTEPFKDYQFNLENMVNACTKKQANVILLTSITERIFKNGQLVECHGDYPRAVKELATKLNIPCIDMYQLTRTEVSRYGSEKSKSLYMNFESGIYESYPDGLSDDTHLRYDGAYMVANCFYKEMMKLGLYTDLFIGGDNEVSK